MLACETEKQRECAQERDNSTNQKQRERERERERERNRNRENLCARDTYRITRAREKKGNGGERER